MATSKEMTSGRIFPQLFYFTLPLLAGNLLQQTYSFVDIGNLFLHLYKQRQLGNIVDFKYCLMRYSRKRTNTPVVRAVPVWKFKSSLHHEQ